MNVYVVMVDEMIERNGEIELDTITRDLLTVCSSLQVAFAYINANKYTMTEEPSYDVCDYNRVSKYYCVKNPLTKDTSITTYLWIERREVIDNVNYVCNGYDDEQYYKVCGNCNKFKNSQSCTNNNVVYTNDACELFELADNANIAQ